MHPTTTTQSALAAISTAITQMENKRLAVPPPPADLCIPNTAPMTNSAMANSLPDDDDDSNPHDARQLSSLTATFNLQAQMMHTMNVLLVKLNDKVDMLFNATTFPKNSQLPSNLSDLMQPSLTLPTICHNTALQLHHVHPPTQIPPWPLHHANPYTTLAPVSKFSPYKKSIPTNPPPSTVTIMATWQ